jgi:hypothetical protein
VWFRIPASPNPRELSIEASGRTLDLVDLAAFVQPSGDAPPPLTRRPNACAGAGLGGADAAQDRASALVLRVPARRSVLVQAGRRGGEEEAVLTLAETLLPLAAPVPGDLARARTPRLRPNVTSRVRLGGATTSDEDPAAGGCPALGGVWRRLTPRRTGTWALTASGAYASALSVFAGGKRPSTTSATDCIDREGGGLLRLRFRARKGRSLWVRVGADRPPGWARASLRFAPARAGDVRSGGACLGARSPRIGGRFTAPGATAKSRNAFRSVALWVTVRRGPVCAARLELIGPGGHVYARGEVPALRARTNFVRVRRVRRLVRGRYRLKVESAGLAGVRSRVPSSLSFRLG